MKNLFVIGTLILATGCSIQPVSRPTTVAWKYGAGNGDPVANPAPQPVFSRLYGYGNGDPVKNGQDAKTSFIYGGENGGSMPMQFEAAK